MKVTLKEFGIAVVFGISAGELWHYGFTSTVIGTLATIICYTKFATDGE